VVQALGVLRRRPHLLIIERQLGSKPTASWPLGWPAMLLDSTLPARQAAQEAVPASQGAAGQAALGSLPAQGAAGQAVQKATLASQADLADQKN